MSGAIIHATAIVSPDATIGDHVTIGPFTIIEAGVEIGSGSAVGSHCHIGHPVVGRDNQNLRIGAGATIRSHSVFYAGSSVGSGLKTGHFVVVREAVFAGRDLQIGTGSDIQGFCTIGDYVRMHSHVQINHRTRIGNFVWLFPYVTVLNDPRPPSDTLEGAVIDDFAAVAARAVILPGVSIGRDALIAAGSLVRCDVSDGMICMGHPGRVVGRNDKIMLRHSLRPAYPWRRHFHRGYPADVVATWRAEFPEG